MPHRIGAPHIAVTQLQVVQDHYDACLSCALHPLPEVRCAQVRTLPSRKEPRQAGHKPSFQGHIKLLAFWTRPLNPDAYYTAQNPSTLLCTTLRKRTITHIRKINWHHATRIMQVCALWLFCGWPSLVGGGELDGVIFAAYANREGQVCLHILFD